MHNRAKKIIYLGMLACLCGLVFARLQAAGAQESAAPAGVPEQKPEQQKPELTPPVSIAMIFSKLTGQAPDFDFWARQTEAYKAAAAFDQPAVAAREARTLEDIYRLLTLQEPMVIRTAAKLSPYSTANKGFFVESFKADTFFPVSYGGQSYAIIPQGIMDKQWLKVPDPAAAKAIEAAAAADKDRLLAMVLQLTPESGDKSAPTRVDGNDYWLLAADIKKMALYTADGSLLWQSDDAGLRSESARKLLNLYQ